MSPKSKRFMISIHAPRTGSDLGRRRHRRAAGAFQSTLPARGATQSSTFITHLSAFQSTLPARGATLRRCRERNLSLISIHAPRTGSDCQRGIMRLVKQDFNPRSPHGERLDVSELTGGSLTFQSTLPARGATNRDCLPARLFSYFNPRSPHGERPFRTSTSWSTARFQSTLPARGATIKPPAYYDTPEKISIHAPRTGSDLMRWQTMRTLSHFNPRSPHGERLRKVTILSIRIIGFAQKVYHKTVLLRISLAENAVILPEKPRNPVRTSLQKAGGLRFARAIRAARPYSISSPSGA